MKTLVSMRAVLLTLVFVASLGMNVGEVEGKGVTATVNGLPMLAYFFNNAAVYTGDTVLLSTAYDCMNKSCGWIRGLYAGSSASITYKAKLFNNQTNAEIVDGASVSVGTIIRAERDTSTLGTDISWVGTGYSNDSPYGRWVSGAESVSIACHLEDKVGSNKGVGLASSVTYDSYVLLNTNPPTTSVINPSSNLSCSGNICTVTGSGSVSIGMNFGATYGKFYYRYFNNNSNPSVHGCHANNVQMRDGTSLPVSSAGVPNCVSTIFQSYADCLGGSSYILNIPAQTITFSLTAVGGNNNPNPPTITPQPMTGVTNTSYPFTFTATDPDNNTLRYQIDWNNDGVTDVTTPSGSFVNSGTAQSASNASNLWTTPGTKTFQARTEDSQGGLSTWTTAQVTISLPAVPTITTEPATSVTNTTMIINGTGNPNGDTTTGWFRYSTTNPGSCNDTFGTRAPLSGGTNLGTGNTATPFNQSLSGLTQNTTYYYCAIGSNGGGTAYGTIRTALTLPSTPTGLTATPNASCGSGSITVTWNAVSGAGSYDIERDGVWTNVGNTTTYTHNGLANSTTHTYRVRANNNTGSSIPSSSTQGTTAAVCPFPDLVSQNLTLSAGPYRQGTPITFTAQVRNIGTVTTGSAFKDNFSYQWNGTGGTWTDITPFINESALGVGSIANDTQTLTPAQSGTLYIQHCVDAEHVINEGGNEANCTVSAAITVLPPPTGTITATPGSMDANSTSTITWNTQNTAGLVCRVTGGTTGPWDALSGTRNETLTATRTYILGCGTTYSTINIPIGSVTVTVNSQPTLTGTPQRVPQGQNATLTWNTHNGNEATCTLTGGTLSTNPLDPTNTDTPMGDVNTGSVTIQVNAQTTYTLTCPLGTDSAMIEIVPVGFET